MDQERPRRWSPGSDEEKHERKKARSRQEMSARPKKQQQQQLKSATMARYRASLQYDIAPTQYDSIASAVEMVRDAALSTLKELASEL